MSHIDHKPGCVNVSTYTRTNSVGVTWTLCRGCDGRNHQAPEITAHQPRILPGSYRCRVHHDQPVTWRGKGCQLCSNPKTQQAQATAAANTKPPRRERP